MDAIPIRHINWEKIIQDFLLPNLLRLGISTFSMIGDHKNFSEYINAAQLTNPIIVNEIPTSLNQADNVVKINM